MKRVSLDINPGEMKLRKSERLRLQENFIDMLYR